MKASRSLITAPGVLGRTLPAALTINGITRTPVWRYRGKDATTTAWPAWGYGGGLSVGGAGADPRTGLGSPGLGELDGAVGFGGKNLAGENLSDISGKDLALEAVLYHSGDNNKRIWGAAANPGDGTTGFLLQQYSAMFSPLFYDGGTFYGGMAMAAGIGWYHLIFFFDQSAGAVGYLNGVAGSVNTACAGIDPGVNSAITWGGIGGQLWTGDMAYCALWVGTDWLDTYLQAAVAKERFTQALGCLAAHNHGAAVPSTL